MDDFDNSKQRKSDRIIVVRGIEGKSITSSTGLIDNRLFTGENNLHAVMDDQSTLWYLKYERGGLPEPLKQKFTSFKSLLDYAEKYFKRRNVEIVEVLD